MFAAATSAAASAAASFFKTSAISQNYILTQPSTGGYASSSGTSSPGPRAPESNYAPFTAGLWRVQEAVHKTNGKRVSVWTFDHKKNSALERLAPPARERVVEVLKAEASALTRLRHPCILEMVEPLEETRSELSFATEPVSSTLAMAIPGSSPGTKHSEPIDEIEIQKGVLQLSKGLSFLHTSARLVHTNLTPDSILINASGDWKLSGLGLTIPLLAPDGTPTKWDFPSYDVRIPPSSQRSFDYIAPEYALNEQIVTASDMYSLGCVIFAVHAKGSPPFKNHNSLSSMRSNVGRLEGGGGFAHTAGWDRDLLSLVTALITPTPLNRLSSDTISTHAFFSSTAVSTLNFLDPSTFAPKPREEKIAFMKGLQTVLPRFSEGMRRRKILPSILAEMKDPLLLPSILPNVFHIASTLDATQFQQLVLPSLKPLFALNDPPQNMIVLLENLGELQKKTAKNVFRSDVLPLVYNALDSEHPAVQERALVAVPELCDTIDYAELQGVLFPRVARVFTKTHVLSVKVSTLNCFLSMIKTLDTASLTQKLVPLLSRIKTKEPAVMLATLNVHEAMGHKVDREAVALMLLPQLWQMSVGPLLNVDQFTRFMTVIRSLTDRVEKEHAQHLRDSQRLEDRSALAANGSPSGFMDTGPTDFATLVGGGAAKPAGVITPTMTGQAGVTGTSSLEDDIWGSILGNGSSPQTPAMQLTSPQMAPAAPAAPTAYSQSLPGSPLRTNARLAGASAGARTLGARPITQQRAQSPPMVTRPGSSQSSYFPNPTVRANSISISSTPASPYASNPAAPATIPAQSKPIIPSHLSSPPLQPSQPARQQPSTFFPPLQPQSSSSSFGITPAQPLQPASYLQPQQQSASSSRPGPNYNISLEPSAPVASPPLQPISYTNSPTLFPTQTAPSPLFPAQPMQPQQPRQPAFFSATPLQPQRTASATASNTGKSSMDFSGFDPLL